MNSSSTVTINGVTYSGDNVSIVGGRIIVEGKEQSQQIVNHLINVQVNGDVHEVNSVSGDISINGSVGSVSSVSGDVNVRGGVTGSVSTVSGDSIDSATGGSNVIPASELLNLKREWGK